MNNSRAFLILTPGLIQFLRHAFALAGASVRRLVDILVLITIVVPSLAVDTTSASLTAEDFGYNSANRIVGEQPLLTILVNYQDSDFKNIHSPDYYEFLLFATFPASVAGTESFFEENSYSQFRFTNAGIVGPFRNPDNPDTPVGNEEFWSCAFGETVFGPIPPVGDPSSEDFVPALCGTWHWDPRAAKWENKSLEALLANAIINASNSGFPFRDFDTDENGVVTLDELIILVVDAKKPTSVFYTGGAVRTPHPLPIPVGEDLVVSMPVTVAGEDVGAMTLAHELTHLLHNRVGGSYEAYGAAKARGKCLNFPYTTLSCTSFRIVGSKLSFDLDPFAKMKLGWLRPQLLTVNDGACLALDPAETTGQAYLIYDKARSPYEFFLLEYREPAVASGFSYDGDPWDASAHAILESGGLAIWYVQIDDSGWPFNIPTIAKVGKEAIDTTLFLVSPSYDKNTELWGLAVNWGIGYDALWDANSRTANPVWLDGNDSGFFAKVIAKRISPKGRPKLIIELGSTEPRPCLEVPLPEGMDYERDLNGVDTWTHTDFILERNTTIINPQDDFTVSWSLIPLTDRVVSVSIEDSYPDEFVPLSQTGTSVSFSHNPSPGQSEQHQYLMQAADREGGFKINSKIAISLSDGNGAVASDNYDLTTIHASGPVSIEFDVNIDHDEDGFPSNVDNCIFYYNSDQADRDNDGLGDICDYDDDNDGVNDRDDQCGYTGIGDPVNDTGCSVGDLCSCNLRWKNHGKYVSCVAKTAKQFLDIGLITEKDKAALVSAGAKSSCGVKKFSAIVE